MPYKVRKMADLFGRHSHVVSRDHGGHSSLTSIMNYLVLTNSSVTLPTTLPEDQVEPYVKNLIGAKIIQVMRSLPGNRENLDYAADLCNMVSSRPQDIRLNPVLSSIAEFERTTSYDIFQKFEIPVFHVWSFSKKDTDRLAATGPWTYSEVKIGNRKPKRNKVKNPSNVELSETQVDSSAVGKGDTEETEELKMAMIASKLEMGLSAQDDAESSTDVELAETEWIYFTNIIDSIDEQRGTLRLQSLLSLKQKISEHMVAILYWNGEFCTICKHNGNIFMLLDDEEILVTHPRASWKMLTTVDQEELFVDDRFIPTNREVHWCSSIDCTLTFFSKINCERHRNTHLPASKVEQISSWNEDSLKLLWNNITPKDAEEILLHGDSVIKGLYGSSFEEIIRKWVVGAEFRLTPADVSTATWNLKRFLGGKKKPSSEELLDFLNIASESTFMCNNVLQNKKLFEELMPKSDSTLENALACFSLIIEQSLAQKWHYQMGEQADNKVQELLEAELLEEELRKKIKARKDDKIVKVEDVIEDINIKDEATIASTSTNTQQDVPEVDVSNEKKPKLLPSDILHWAPLQGEEYFPIFAARNILVMVYTVFSGEKSLALTRIGRRAAKRLLKFILRAHKNGKSWNGDWDLRDIRVKSNSQLIIAKEAELAASKGTMFSDLQKFIEILAPYYTHEDVEGYPAFFDEFLADAMDVPDPLSEKFALFQKFMLHHLAFMPPLARSQLYCGLFKVCDMLREEQDFGYIPLSGKNDAPEWRTKARIVHPYHDVYYYGIHQGLIGIYDPYWMNYSELLRFLKNYWSHGHEYTKINNVQVVTDVIVFDLMVSKDFGMFITKLILFLMYHCKMEGPFFSTWDSFETSDGETLGNDE